MTIEKRVPVARKSSCARLDRTVAVQDFATKESDLSVRGEVVGGLRDRAIHEDRVWVQEAHDIRIKSAQPGVRAPGEANVALAPDRSDLWKGSVDRFERAIAGGVIDHDRRGQQLRSVITDRSETGEREVTAAKAHDDDAEGQRSISR